MLNNNDTMNNYKFIIVLFLSLYKLSLGISEAVMLSEYNDMKNDCEKIWIYMCCMCVVNFISAFSIWTVMIEKDDKSNNNDIGNFISLGLGVWNQVIWFNIENECKLNWTENAPELWTLFTVEFVNFWIGIGILGLILLMLIMFGCCLLCVKNKDKNLIDNGKKILV